jgi:hypothetical protein
MSDKMSAGEIAIAESVRETVEKFGICAVRSLSWFPSNHLTKGTSDE